MIRNRNDFVRRNEARGARENNGFRVPRETIVRFLQLIYFKAHKKINVDKDLKIWIFYLLDIIYPHTIHIPVATSQQQA